MVPIFHERVEKRNSSYKVYGKAGHARALACNESKAAKTTIDVLLRHPSIMNKYKITTQFYIDGRVDGDTQ